MPKKDRPIPRSWYPGPLLYEGVREIAHRRRTKMNSVVRRAFLLYFVAQPEFDEEFTAYLVQSGLSETQADEILNQLEGTRRRMRATDEKALSRFAAKLRAALEDLVSPDLIEQIVYDVVGPLDEDE